MAIFVWESEMDCVKNGGRNWIAFFPIHFIHIYLRIKSFHYFLLQMTLQIPIGNSLAIIKSMVKKLCASFPKESP